MKKLKNLLNNLDKLNLKIMKIGINFCFSVAILATLLLCTFLFNHSIFLFELGLLIFKLSTYLSVEFIVCGIVADKVKQQI